MKPIFRFVFACLLLTSPTTEVLAEFRAGAAAIDASPTQFPVLVNGGMTSRTADKVVTPIMARAIVLDDGGERLAIVVVDSCMMPRPMLDEAKALAAKQTKIQPDRMLISATHTHTAPSSMGCLGTDPDPNYVPFLRDKIVESIVAAEANLEPAQVGWGVADAAPFTALRRWIRRPDRLAEDPFGNPTVRANMHAGGNWDDVTGESGPKDPDLSMISLQAKDGRPIALLANFSMHYFGAGAGLHADYFGLFCNAMESRVAPSQDDDTPAFVAIMSHGCSGDIWRRDYTIPEASRPAEHTIDSYTKGLLDVAMSAYETIDYRQPADLAMAEARLPLKYRVPSKQRLEWAQRIVEETGDRLPKTLPEIYAREQVLLHERQSTEVVVQALRIGDIAIASTPTETYALTGLKLKLQSPLQKTMVIELANGGDGYIPPPEQHHLGGYNTWAARSAGLEVQAEPKIAAASLGLLEKVAGQSRRDFQQGCGPGCEAIQQAKPAAYWRMDEMAGPRAVDSSGQNRDAIYERGVVYFLAGPRSDAFAGPEQANRAAHFAGERMQARVADLGDQYTVSLWFWNGMPVDGRAVTGWMFSRDHDNAIGPHGDHLGIGGKANHPGRLIFLHGNDAAGAKLIAGKTEIERWNWYHVVLVRDQDQVRVHLNGNPQPEIETQSPAGFPASFERLFLGGRSDNESNWEGRLDEIAVFDRALSPAEVGKLYPQ